MQVQKERKPGWKKTDKNGKTFYYNPITKVRSMVDPTGGFAVPDGRALKKSQRTSAFKGRVSRGSSFSGSFSGRARGMSTESMGSIAGGRKRQSINLHNSVIIHEAPTEDRFAKLKALANVDDSHSSIDVDAMASQLEPEEDLSQYDWENWGTQHFNLKKLKRKPVHVDELLRWTNMPIKRALQTMSHPKLDKKAQNSFKYIQMFMGEFTGPASKALPQSEAARAVLKIAIDDSPDELRDEIFCQMLKQVTNNPNPTNELKGWQLIALAVGAFPPGVFFEPFLRRYVDETRGNTRDAEVQKYAQYAKLRLDMSIQAGPRSKVPCDEEIAATLNRKAVSIPVFFVNGQEVKMQAETWTSVGDLKDAVSKLLHINDNAIFCISEVGEDMSEYALPDTERVLDVLSDWEEEYGSYKSPKDIIRNKFVFKLRLFVEIDPTDDAAVDLAYFQAVHDVTDSRYPCSETDCIRLVALQAQEMYGNFSPNGPFGDEFEQFLPGSFEASAPLKHQVMQEYESLAGMDKKTAKLEYLKYVQEWPSYGCQVFPVSPENNPEYPTDIYLAVNARGVFIIDPPTKEFLSEFKWDQIMNWGNSDETFCLVLGDYLQQAKLWFRTEQPLDIKRLVEAYGIRIKKDRT